MSLLKCENLSIGYDKHPVINNINFDINIGDYLCIVGENGAGKSTLMKTLLHLIPVVGGSIIYGDGLDSTQIGYLPQQTVIQKDFPCSCYEIVISGFEGKKKIRPFYNKYEKEQSLNNMNKLGIGSFVKRCYNELSGGQQQRVLLARALCATSKLLILDEPVAGLDPKVSNELYNIINDLNKIDKITIVMVTHDIDIALNYASHILHIGHEIFFGNKFEYLNSDIGKKYVNRGKK